jgi:hypothetical protein
MKKNKVQYLALDDKMEREFQIVGNCLSVFNYTAEFRNSEGFVRIYRFSNE